MAAFTPEFLAAQKEKLLAERQRLHDELQAIDQAVIELGQSQNDFGAGVGNHMADEVSSDVEQQDNNLAIRANIEQVLSEVDHALTKFAAGTYGICEDTGEQIAEARLEALPYARYTVKAQEKREMSGTYHPVPSIR